MPLQELFQQQPLFFYLAVGLLSLAVGSFLNVVIHRVPIMLHRQWDADCRELLDQQSGEDPEPFNLMRPGSRCPQCGHAITAAENIPVLSYLFLRGKCSDCGTTISLRYPLVEAVTALLSLVVAWHFGPTPQTIAALLLTWSLISLTMIDVDHKLLPDNITLPMLWVGLLCSLFGLFASPEDAIVGALAGYLSLWTVFQLFRLITGKEGMGYGDFKLFALFGAWLGWQYLPQIILLSSLVGAIVGITLVVLGRDRDNPIPFGPYLAAAGWISLLWGEQINRAYLQFAGF